ncbi:MAG TPA: serine/threonine-protein phosphatase, partial [Eubacteriaceae bacterium]|nr:serine/threonine-protein phosphatase [Eubacteriaceae bacterium]
MDVGFKSDIGKRRETNQDAFMVYRPSRDCGFFAVADGLGGHQAGEVASNLAVQNMKERLASLGNDIRLDDFPRESVGKWIEEINRLIIKEGDKDPSRKGMGTTFTMGCVLQTTLLVYHIS